MLKNFLLLVVATVLFIILAPIGFVYGLITRARFDISKFFKKLGVSIDQTGGVFVQYLFNDIMITEDGTKFGDEDKTISATLGKNEHDGTLAKCGKLLAGLLNRIEKDHCYNAYLYEYKNNQKG